MKNLKNFIAESVFDDNLTDKSPVDHIYQWFDNRENVSFGRNKPIKEIIEIQNNTVYFIANFPPENIYFYKCPPSFIKFDEKSWSDRMIAICYDITSQKDIDWAPGEINYINCDSCADISLDANFVLLKINNIKGITLNPSNLLKNDYIKCVASFSNQKNVKDIHLLSIKSKAPDTAINIDYTNLANKFKRQIKAGEDIYKKNKKLFDGLYQNNIKYLEIEDGTVIKISKGKVGMLKL